MYIGSPAFQTANQKTKQKQKVRGTIDAISYTSTNIMTGTFTVSNQISDQSDSKIGSVHIGKLTGTFLKNTPISARTWRGRKITVEAGLCVSENPDIYEFKRVGEFYVAEATISAEGTTVTAYDAMSFFDKILPNSFLANGTVYDITMSVCTTCGVRFGMSERETQSLPNGTEPLGAFLPNDCKTYRDVLHWLAVTIGGFATINTYGELIYKSFETIPEPAEEINPFVRVSGATFSDYITDFGSATFENPDGTVETLGSLGIGAQYNVGFNPFMQYGTNDTKAAMRAAVFECIQNMRFMPFKIERLSMPVYDLGDILMFTGGLVSDIQHIGIVHAMTWTAGKGVTLQGFGANPNLTTAQTTKNEANSAAQRATAASEMVYRRFGNLTQITVENEEEQVVNIDFVTNKETDVEMWHELQIETELTAEKMTVEAVYYLDNVEMERHPVETYTDSSKHLLTLNYSTFIESPGSHNWAVKLTAEGGTVRIQPNDVLAVLKGQGIAKADGWSGIIILDDIFDRNAMEIHVRDYTDSAQVTIHDNLTTSVSDTYQRTKMECNSRSYTQEYNIIFYQPEFGINTEDDIPMVDEVDAFIITE